MAFSPQGRRSDCTYLVHMFTQIFPRSPGVHCWREDPESSQDAIGEETGKDNQEYSKYWSVLGQGCVGTVMWTFFQNCRRSNCERCPETHSGFTARLPRVYRDRNIPFLSCRSSHGTGTSALARNIYLLRPAYAGVRPQAFALIGWKVATLSRCRTKLPCLYLPLAQSASCPLMAFILGAFRELSGTV